MEDGARRCAARAAGSVCAVSIVTTAFCTHIQPQNNSRAAILRGFVSCRPKTEKRCTTCRIRARVRCQHYSALLYVCRIARAKHACPALILLHRSEGLNSPGRGTTVTLTGRSPGRSLSSGSQARA